MPQLSPSLFFFFFNDTATTEIYTLSLHDALPILKTVPRQPRSSSASNSDSICGMLFVRGTRPYISMMRSEEHTSELQSLRHLVCRLLLEKKKRHYMQQPAAWHRTRPTGNSLDP